MAQYRRKPIVVDAVQFDESRPWPEGVRPAGMQHNTPRDALHGRTYWPIGAPLADTVEGRKLVVAGDWIITDINGDRSLCKPGIFKTAYEPVVANATEEKGGIASERNIRPILGRWRQT